MSTSTKTRRAMLGLIIAASAVGTIAQAQDAARPVPPPPGGQGGEVVVNCCRCLGQESGAINISTGTAPWRVSSVMAPPWAVTQLNGPTNTSPLMVPGAIAPNSAWTTVLAPAQWLQPSASTIRNDGFANGHVTYVLKIRVPNCTIKQRVVLTGRLAADDKAVMFVDNSPVALTPGTPAYAGFPTSYVRNFSHVLSGPGVYTLRVEVDNLGQGPFAMILNGTANGKCDDKLEKGKDDRAEDCKDC